MVEFRNETYKRWRGRYDWISRREETWSNPEFAGPHPWGLMVKCPQMPEE